MKSCYLSKEILDNQNRLQSCVLSHLANSQQETSLSFRGWALSPSTNRTGMKGVGSIHLWYVKNSLLFHAYEGTFLKEGSTYRMFCSLTALHFNLAVFYLGDIFTVFLWIQTNNWFIQYLLNAYYGSSVVLGSGIQWGSCSSRNWALAFGYMIGQTWVEGTGVWQRGMLQETNGKIVPRGTLDVELTFLKVSSMP